MPTAVVTGAAGFLGSALSAELRTRGWDVRATDLIAGDDLVTGDVTSADGWPERLAGADLVVHTAAIVAESGDRAAFQRVNVEGTRNVLSAAAEAGVGRALHLSSIVVYGRDFPDRVTEDAPLVPTGAPYTDTKVAAEHAALRVAADTGLDLVIVRPGDVYGPGSQPWTVRPVDLLRRGLFALVDGGNGILTPTYVDDLVAGALAAAERPDGSPRIYNITGGRGVTAREFFDHYAEALGVPLRSLPRAVVAGLARGAGVAARLRGRTPPISVEAIEYVTHPGTYSIERARDHLGWEPRVDLAAGMARTLAWLRAQATEAERPRAGRPPDNTP